MRRARPQFRGGRAGGNGEQVDAVVVGKTAGAAQAVVDFGNLRSPYFAGGNRRDLGAGDRVRPQEGRPDRERLFGISRDPAAEVHGEVHEPERKGRRSRGDAIVAVGRSDESGLGNETVFIRAGSACDPERLIRGGPREEVFVDDAAAHSDVGPDVHVADPAEDIARHAVTGFVIPDVRVQRVADHDVVAHRAEESLTQLDAAGGDEVVFDQVIGRAVVEVDAPTVPAVEPVAAQDDRVDRVQLGEGFDEPEPVAARARPDSVELPEAVPAPGVERAVVVRLPHGVPRVVTLDAVAAPGAVVHVDRGPGMVAMVLCSTTMPELIAMLTPATCFSHAPRSCIQQSDTRQSFG